MAEDLTQEVFIKIWENRETLYNVQSFKNYLFVTSRNHTLNAMKKAFRSEAAMGVMISSFVSTRNTIEEDVIHGEYLEFLNSVLNSLPQRTRDIFKMCREQGKSYDEVATELGISRNAVKNHMVASIKALSLSVRKELGLPLSVFLIILHYH